VRSRVLDGLAAGFVVTIFWVPALLHSGRWLAAPLAAGVVAAVLLCRRFPAWATATATALTLAGALLELLHAVRTVHAGHAMSAPEVTARLRRQFSPRRPAGRHVFADVVLSERELRVARLVARGHSNRQIADELLLSLETVRTYLRRMFAKLGIDDRTHLALAVLAHPAGLLSDLRRER
jgi:DNA-binding CsgD family transcriptional regulator